MVKSTIKCRNEQVISLHSTYHCGVGKCANTLKEPFSTFQSSASRKKRWEIEKWLLVVLLGLVLGLLLGKHSTKLWESAGQLSPLLIRAGFSSSGEFLVGFSSMSLWHSNSVERWAWWSNLRPFPAVRSAPTPGHRQSPKRWRRTVSSLLSPALTRSAVAPADFDAFILSFGHALNQSKAFLLLFVCLLSWKRAVLPPPVPAESAGRRGRWGGGGADPSEVTVPSSETSERHAAHQRRRRDRGVWVTPSSWNRVNKVRKAGGRHGVAARTHARTHARSQPTRVEGERKSVVPRPEKRSGAAPRVAEPRGEELVNY